MKMILYVLFVLVAVLAGGFVFLAVTDTPVAQAKITRDLPATQFIPAK